jgi:hypothetical protein
VSIHDLPQFEIRDCQADLSIGWRAGGPESRSQFLFAASPDVLRCHRDLVAVRILELEVARWLPDQA